MNDRDPMQATPGGIRRVCAEFKCGPEEARRILASKTTPTTPWAPTGKDQRFLRSMRIDPQTEETWR